MTSTAVDMLRGRDGLCKVTESEIGKVASGACRGKYLMAKSAQEVTLPPSWDIPFDKLVLSQSNVRRIKAGISTEELAKDATRADCCKA